MDGYAAGHAVGLLVGKIIAGMFLAPFVLAVPLVANHRLMTAIPPGTGVAQVAHATQPGFPPPHPVPDLHRSPRGSTS